MTEVIASVAIITAIVIHSYLSQARLYARYARRYFRAAPIIDSSDELLR